MRSIWFVVSKVNYYMCDTKETAFRLFEKIVRENYFDGTEEEEEELKAQLGSPVAEWEYEDNYISCSAEKVLTIDDVNHLT